MKFSPVAIMLESSCDFVVAMFAAIKSGRGFLPIDVNTPKDRLQYILAEAGVETVFTCADFLDHFEQLNSVKVIDVKQVLEPEHSYQSVAKLPLLSARPKKDDLVYVIYTSGSTGRPKGVPITHENLLPLMLWQKKHFNISSNTKMTQTLSLSFDFGVQEVLTTLLFGGTLFIPAKQVRLSADRYVDYINSKKITMLYSTPSHLLTLCAYDRLHSLDVVLVGGEVFTKQLAVALSTVLRESTCVFNGYGPTEASINATMYHIKDTTCFFQQDVASHSVPIGTPSGNSKVYILDAEGWPVPRGVLGEIYISGPGVSSSGYINNPETTKHSFLKLPHFPSKLFYKTGDFARWNEADLIEYVGRKDTMRKIRGHRVELSEIEEVLSACLCLNNALVRVMSIAKRDFLVAFVPGGQLNLSTEYCQQKVAAFVPAYMVPDAFVSIDSIKLSKNNKVDERYLYNAFSTSHSAGTRTVSEGSLMSSVLSIVQEVMQKPLTVDMDLFAQGADSVLLSSIHQRIEKKLGVSFSIIDIFQYTTIKALTAYLLGVATQSAHSHVDVDEASQRSRSRKQNMRRHRERAQKIINHKEI